MGKKTHSPTVDQEAARLKSLFGDREQAAFAKEYGFPGGASMISQHLHARRPINLEHGLIYAQGLGVTLDKISPRLVELVQRATTLLPASSAEHDQKQQAAATVAHAPVAWPFKRVTPGQWRRLSADQAASVESVIEQFVPVQETGRRRAVG